VSGKDFAVDDSVVEHLLSIGRKEHPVLRELRQATAKMPGAGMQISPLQANVMRVLLRLMAARRVLEVGTFTGYSALAMAFALPEDGELLTLDVDAETTEIARQAWQKAGMSARIQAITGPATETMDALIAEGRTGDFDFAFIDADKINYPHYWERALVLLRQGGGILVDNILYGGAALSSVSDEDLIERAARRPPERRQAMLESARAIRAFNSALREDDRVDLVSIPISDGITLAVKK
jgi:predicted O-methyltransferase YrrM